MLDKLKSLWLKITALLACIAVLAFIIWTQHQITTKQALIEQSITQMKQLGGGVVRDEQKYVSREDLEKIIKAANIDLGPIQSDLKKLGADVQGISTALANTPGYVADNLHSTSTIKRTDAPSTITTPVNYNAFGYLQAAQVLDIKEPLPDKTYVPFGSVQFRAWQSNPWELTVLPRTYNLNTVVGQDQDGKQYLYNKFSITIAGKQYPVQIQNAKYVEQLPEVKFRFNPHILMGFDTGILITPLPRAEVTPNLQVSLFSYSKTKLQPDWIFLGLGAGYEIQSKRLGILISPVKYNIGSFIPLVHNLYIGPTITFDTAGRIGVMGGIDVLL